MQTLLDVNKYAHACVSAQVLDRNCLTNNINNGQQDLGKLIGKTKYFGSKLPKKHILRPVF